MDRNEKQAAIGELKQRFDRMTSLVLLDYKGINVETVTKLRAEFRKAGVEYKVAKNTLVKQALKGTKLLDVLSPHLRGMTAFAWSYEDPSAAAKVVKNFLRDNAGKVAIRGGVIEGTVLDATAVTEQLATMPGKDELRAQLLATMQAPMQQLVALLAAPSQNFAYLLDAKHREMGGTSE
ncbi:MAG: 50S ribosomal protein L10 [Deltaproteobacteria bacterium]|nr:50S ribosomal protein L10 [Deltaproteobacteria bacterium]